MDALQQQLAQLTPEQVAQLLDASGHAQLLQSTSAPSDAASAEARALEVEQARQRGNEHFRSKHYDLAVEAYSVAIALDLHNATCFSNRAAAHLKLEAYECAIDDCTRAIDLAPSIKPLLRRATAHIALHAFASAVRDLVAALAFEPTNRECVTALSTLAQRSSSPPNPQPVDRVTRIAAALAIVAQRGWTPLSVKGNPAPPALNGHALVRVDCDCDDNKKECVLLFGGRSVRDHKPLVYAMDNCNNSSSSSWEVVETTGDVPPSRAWHSFTNLNAAGDRLSVFGGVSSLGEDAQLFILSTTTAHRGMKTHKLHWSQPRSVTGDVPTARSGHAAVFVSTSTVTGSRTLLFGGRTRRGVSDELFVLYTTASSDGDDSDSDSVACEWKRVARSEPWPAPRDGHTLCVVHNVVVLYGGNGQENDDKRSDVWLFDLTTHRWTELATRVFDVQEQVPLARSYHTAHAVGRTSCMIVVGGRTKDDEDSGVYVLDIVTATWFCLPIPSARRLTARAWHASVLLSRDRLFVLGGGTSTGPRTDAAVFDLAAFTAFMDDDDDVDARA